MDTLSRGGAELLARRIEDYWAKRGFKVNTTIKCVSVTDKGTVWIVRSDLVNGFPRKRV